MATTTHPVTKITKDNKVWAKELGLTDAGFSYRLGNMTLEDTFSKPVQVQVRKKKTNTKRVPIETPIHIAAPVAQSNPWFDVVLTFVVFVAGFIAGALLEHTIYNFF